MNNIEINNITGPIELLTKNTICLNNIEISSRKINYMPSLFDRTVLEYHGDLSGKSLREDAFTYRSQTQIIDLKNVKSVHRRSFFHMNALKKLYLRNDTKVSISGIIWNHSVEELFSYETKNGKLVEYIPKIYVPSNLVQEYKDDSEGWGKFADNIYPIENDALNLSSDYVNNFILDSNQKIQLNTTMTYCEKNYKIDIIQRDLEAQNYLTGNFTTYIDNNNEVTILAPYAFGYRPELQKVDLGTNLTRIQTDSFFNKESQGTSLTTVVIRNPNKPVILEVSGVFDLAVNLHKDDFTIYVPENLVDAYKEASNWSEYADYIKSLPNNEEEN